MIISQEEEIVFGSNNQQSTAFGIENNAKAFILLSDKLYTNKPYAVVRELSTNCLDAHKLNGQTRPFQVKPPTRLDPRLVIRDFGPGLSDFQIRGDSKTPGLYTTYFASTKSDSNDFIGAMGLGSKSPFSYTKTFTIVSYHNGRKLGYTAVMKNKGPDIIPLFDKPMEEDEVSGIEITVPVKTDDINKWHTEIARTFRTFAGVEPEIVGSQIEIDYFPEFTPEKQWFSVERSNFEQSNTLWAVYGRIVYPIKISEIPDLKYEWLLSRYGRVYVHFDLGELDITPSREELSYNDETIENIRNKINHIEESTIKADLERLQSIENKRQLVRELNDLNRDQRRILGGMSIKIQDKTFSEWMDIFNYKKIENMMANSSMVCYRVDEDALRRRITTSWSVRSRISASHLVGIEKTKIFFMIDDKPSRRASTIRGMYHLNMLPYLHEDIILVDPNNEDQMAVIEEAKRLFEGDEVIIFKCSDMEQARIKDAEVNQSSGNSKEGTKRPKSANVQKWTLTGTKWDSESFCMSANEVRELEGYAVGINRENIVEYPSGYNTGYCQSSIKAAVELTNIKEFWMIRPSAMKYAQQNSGLLNLFEELVSKYIELIDTVGVEVIPPSFLNKRRLNNVINIKPLNPLIKHFIESDAWESSIELNQMAKAMNARIHSPESANYEIANNLALCQEIYNNLIKSANTDFSKKSEVFEKTYPVIWYMLDEWYVVEEKYYNDLAKIAALQGAI